MKIKKIVGIRIEVDPPYGIARWARGYEQVAKSYESWARDFEEFVRDHRSQDPISLSVVREHSEVCSYCDSEWEQDADGPCCCDEAQQEWNTSKLERIAS